MRILVVGGSGFIGKNFLLKSNPYWEYFATYCNSIDFPSFLESNNLRHVTPIHVNLTNLADAKKIVRETGTNFDVCLYAMGNSDIGKSTKDPIVDIHFNVIPLLNLLKTIYVKKFIFISSGSVYEGYKGLVNPSLPVNPTIPYSVSKLTSERYIAHFQRNTDHIDNYLCLRFFGAYGPMEPTRKIYSNLIKTFVVDKKHKYILNGDGKNYIDAMYIDDAIEGILKMINSDKGNKILDYCVGQPLTINELVYSAAKALDTQIILDHASSTPEYTTFYASPFEVEALFGFTPQISLEDGLQRFAKYLTQETICQN